MHLRNKHGHVSEFAELVIKGLLFKYMKFSDDDMSFLLLNTFKDNMSLPL